MSFPMQHQSYSKIRVRFLSILAVIVAAGCATIPTYTGTFIGHAEKGELYSRDGKSFPATAFAIVAPKGRLRVTGSPKLPWRLNDHSVVYLIDPCRNVYPPDTYAGKRLEVRGKVVMGDAHPFPGGPGLFGPQQYPEQCLGYRNYEVLIVETIKVPDPVMGMGEETSKATKREK